MEHGGTTSDEQNLLLGNGTVIIPPVINIGPGGMGAGVPSFGGSPFGVNPFSIPEFVW
jgi:hypothetical protein